MRNKFDNILLGTLWILITTLAACFWFNSLYGFDIFSGAHWKHLAYMQAAQNPIKPSFYISMVMFVLIVIVGMYFLARPRLRKITLPIRDTGKPGERTKTETPISTPNTTTQTPEIGLTRPPRLNLGTTNVSTSSTTTAPLTAPVVAPVKPVANSPQPQKKWPEIDEIFESAGYKIMGTPRVGGIQTALCAIGANETIWIGGVNIQKSQLNTIIERLNQIFVDTLEDIPIYINAFIVSDNGITSSDYPDILTFASTDELRTYMQSHPNPTIPENEQEDFNAFAEYISKVLQFIGN